MGAAFQRHPVRAQPHEGSCKNTSSSLHGLSSVTNGIPVHSRGAALPSSSKVQNATDRDVRRSEGPCRLSQYLQESDGVTRISGPRPMQSLRYHIERPAVGLVQQTPAVIDLILQRVIHCIRLPLYRSSDVQEANLSLADHKSKLLGELEVLCPEVQR